MTDHLYAVKKLVDRLNIRRVSFSQLRDDNKSNVISISRPRSSRCSGSVFSELYPTGTCNIVSPRQTQMSTGSLTVEFRSPDGLLSPGHQVHSGSFSCLSSDPSSPPGQRPNSSTDDIFGMALEGGLKTGGIETTAMARAGSEIRRRSDQSRRRLSSTKSMPLSPTARTRESESEKYHNIQLKLDTLTSELMAMRRADQDLAKKLLNIYADIQSFKMDRSCLKYCELLDDAFFEAEMADEVPDLCDAAPKSINKVLMKKGVTSFNISSRRFSCS